jgi:signal transduction histidine kinase
MRFQLYLQRSIFIALFPFYLVNLIFSSSIIPTAIFKYLPYLFLIFSFLFLSLQLNAQIAFFYNNNKADVNLRAISYYTDSSQTRNWQRYQQIKSQLLPLGQNKVNLSYQNKMLWLLIPLYAIEKHPDLHYLIVRNPHINYIGAWVLKGDSVVQEFPLSGDRFVFKQRAFIHPDFVFYLPQKDQQLFSYLLLIDKRNEQLNVPVHFLTDDGFLIYNRIKNLLTGLMMGIGLFLILFSLFLYVQMKERLYIYYAIYIALVFFYIFSDYGYSFMYFFPDHPSLPDFTRPMAVSFATPIYMFFVLALLNTRKLLPAYYKWSMRYLVVYFILLITAILLMSNTGPFRSILVWIMQIYQNISAVWMIVIAVAGIRKKIPYSVYVIFSALTLLFSFFFFMQFVSGYLADNMITRNLMNFGFTAEICILAFVLTLRFKNYKEQSEQLLRTSNLQQEQIFKSISDYQQKEMQRYSSMLHDSVGAQLSAIRLNLESIQHNKNKEQGNDALIRSITDVSQLANDVRQFSHTLSPVLLQKKGLVEAIKETIEGINKNGGLYIQFESIGSLQKTSFRYELLIYNILQELIQNIIKHSQATEAIIQLILEKEMISVFVEDNGKGFEKSFIEYGLGFSQIKQLITFVSGNLNISSAINKGCTVSIEFPLIPHDEEYHPAPPG